MKRIYALIVAVVVFGFLIIPNAQAQPLIPKIDNQAIPAPVSGCAGEDLGFTGSTSQNFPITPVTYPTPRWTVTGPGTLTNANTNTVTYNCATPGTYVLTYYAIKLGITYSVSVNVTTVDKDILTLDLPTSFPYSICEGSSVTLQASGPTDYYWEREKDAVIVPVGITASITDTPPVYGVWTYRVYGSSAGCASIPDNIQFQITVDQSPTVSDGGPYTTCYGTPIALNGSIGGSATSAQWIGGLGTFAPNRNTLNATYTPALSESGTSVSLTLRTNDPIGVCSYVESTTILTVNPLPEAITGTTSVCEGLTTTLSNATPGGSWSSATPAVATIDAGGIVTAITAGTSVISYTLPSGCFVTTTVTVNPLPAAITGTTDVCVGSTSLLSNTTPGGAWSSGTPAVATISAVGLVTGISSGTSVITYTLPTGCKITTTVTVNPLPAAITGTTVVCAGSTTPLSNATPGGSWSSASPAVATIDAAGVVTGVSAGSSVISYTLPTGCFVTTTVTVNPLPAAITGTTTVCVSLTTTLSNATPGGTWSSATPAVATIDVSGVVTGVSVGTSIISYTLPTGCAVTTTVTVNAIPAPITGTTSICLGSTSTLSNSTPGGIWSSATPAVATIDATGLVTSLSVGTTVISYALGSGCTVTTTVTVNPLPAAITGTTTVCRASTTPLSNATPGGTWSSATPAVATINAAGLVTGVAAGTSVISYTLPTGCAATTTVTVNPLPAAIAGIASICVGSTTTLTDATPGGTWSSTNLAVATIDAGGVVTGVAGGTSSIRYTLPTGCLRSRTETVVALPTITLGVVNAVCQDATSFSLPYTATTGTPTTYSISAGVPALAGFIPVVNAAFVASPLIINIPGGSIAGTYQFTITVKNATGCVSIGKNFNLTINPLPSPITGTTNVCVGSTTTLSDATPGGTWSSASPAIATIDAGGVVTGVSSGTSVISYTLGTGCKVTTTVTVNPLPAAIGGTTSVCIGSTTTLTNATPGGTWSSATPAVATIDAGGVVTGVSVGTSVISYTLGTGCAVTTTVTVNPLPTITLGVIAAVCQNANSFNVPYTGTTGTPTTYSVSTGVPALAGFVPVVNAAFVGSPLVIPIPAGSAVGTYQFSITVKNGNGCNSTSQNFSLTINALPTVTFGGILATQCLSSTVYALTGGTPVGGTYSGPGVVGGNFNASVADVGNHTITYTYSDVNGCSGSATNTITVNPLISNNIISTTKLSICYNSIPVQFTGSDPAGGSGSFTYQWQSSTVGAAGPFTDIVGETNKDYSPSVAITQDTWYIRNVSSLPCSDLPSNVIKITVGPVFTVSTTFSSPKCVGSNDGTATAVPVGGTPIMPGSIYNYSWNTTPVQNTITATGLIAGTYIVTVTDNIGCTTTATAVVTDPTPVTLGVPTVIDVSGCFGNNNGSIQIQASGGTGPYKYDLYDNGVFVATQTVAGAVTFTLPTTPITASTLYQIMATDANGCTSTLSPNITVNQPALLTFTYSLVNLSCNGSANGEIHFTPSGGTPPYQYSILGGSPGSWKLSPDFTGLTAGTYLLKVKDVNNCTTTSTSVKLTQPAAIVTDGGTWKDVLDCFGDPTGSISVKVTGGTAPFTFSINGGTTWQPTGDFLNLFAGTYTVIVKDGNGCTTNIGPNTINQPAKINITAEIVDDVTICWNNNNGSIVVLASGGTGDLKFSIDGGATWQDDGFFNNIVTGTYQVAVKDANDCIQFGSLLTVNGPLSITLAPPTVVDLTCNGVIPANGEIHVTATGGTGVLTYRLDGGTYQPNGDFTGLSAGIHTLDVKDANNCLLTQTITVSEPPAINFTTEQKTDITCFGLPADGTITLLANGGTGDLTYTLSTLNPLNPNNGATLTPGAGLPAIFPGLMADSYSYVVTDSKGCNSLPPRNLSIDEPAVISITKQIPTDINCSGGTGTFSVDAIGGTNPLVYNLYDNTHTLVTSNGDGEFTIAVDGTYTVEVTDPNSCGPQIAGPFTFTQPTPIVTSTPVISQMTAPVANDGKIKLSATGGTPDYTFTLNTGPVLNAASGVDVEFTGLSAGVYSIVVTDSKGCTKTVSDLRIGLLDLTLTPTHITCNGLDNGQIVLTINGVQNPPYTTLWDNNGVPLPGYNDLLTIGPPLGPGNYTVNVVDASGVTGKASVTITEPTLFSATYLSTQDKLCFSDVNGSVTFTISGGTPPYTIAWTESGVPKSSIGSIANDVSPGTYTFTITDASSCGAITIPDITLANPAKLNISNIVKTDPNCNGELNGSITVTASGGTGTLGYSITGPINDNNTTGIFSNLPAGNYTVALTDANGCVASSDVLLTVTLTEPTPILVTALTPDQPLACPNIANGFVRLQVSGGTPDYTYLWSNNQQTPDLIDIFSGDYSVLITDAHGCTLNKNITVAGPQMLEIADTLINGAKCSQLLESGDDSGRIEIVSTTGGTGSNFTYLWDFPVTTPATGKIIDKLSAGNYTVTITDENGCIYEHSIFVPSDPNYFMKAYAYKDTTLCGSSPLELVAIPQGGILARTYDYSWYEIPNTSGVPLSKNDTLKVKPTVNTKYYLEIRNDGGCFSNDTVNVVLYPKINLNIPMYISAVQQDSIVNILYGTRYNLDVVPANTEFSTKFKWEPAILFDPDTSWNSSIYIDKEIHDQIRSYEIIMKDPQTKSMKTFIRIKAMAVTEKGCKDSLRLYVKMVDNITFGNVFSPNGDMINDRWEVPKDYLFPDLDIEIFDRWGALVWSASGDKAAKGWDGRTNNGKDLPIGTYYYVVKYNIKTADSNWKPVTGSITIVR